MKHTGILFFITSFAICLFAAGIALSDGNKWDGERGYGGNREGWQGGEESGYRNNRLGGNRRFAGENEENRRFGRDCRRGGGENEGNRSFSRDCRRGGGENERNARFGGSWQGSDRNEGRRFNRRDRFDGDRNEGNGGDDWRGGGKSD